eukprot:scaffold115760_cov65-Attheya_sp.AAC.2
MIRGIDFQESYSAVVLASSVWMTVAITAAENMTLAIIDVKNAFQNTMLPDRQRQHLSLPPYYIAWFRRKYPTGMKPAGRQWNDVLTTVLTTLKFQRNHIDHRVFLFISEDDWFQNDGDPLRTTDTPFCTDNEFERDLTEALPANDGELADLSKQYCGDYCTHMGKFSHVKEWTRPDLGYTLTRLGSFSVAPTEVSFQALKQIARYLATHPHTPFFYPRNVSIDGTNMICHEYDQGLFEEIPAAQLHFLFGVTTDWKIGKQLATAAYSTDAELRSMFTAVKGTLAIQVFMMHLGYGPPKPTHHHEDS